MKWEDKFVHWRKISLTVHIFMRQNPDKFLILFHLEHLGSKMWKTAQKERNRTAKAEKNLAKYFSKQSQSSYPTNT